MCGRFTMLSYDELREVIEGVRRRRAVRLQGGGAEADGGAGAMHREHARPGSAVQAVVPAGSDFAIEGFTWGFPAPGASGEAGGGKLVFNTRIESALSGSRMWADALRDGRCILPAASFYEHSYAFTRPNSEPVLLASVQQRGRISVVTTEPNEAVARVHHRMPLALRFQEVPTWLEGDLHELAELADRADFELEVPPDDSLENGQLSLF